MLEGKTIVITGAADGLGRSWTEGFLKEGATVYALDINEAKLAEVAAWGAVPVTCDVTKQDQVTAAIDRAVSETCKIDVLFNNAGVGFRTRVDELAEGEFEHHVAIHLFGMIYGMRAALPHMREAGYGRIINTISRGGEIPQPRNSGYAAAKAGMFSASRVAAAENQDMDILINMLIPGPTNTGIWGKDMPQLQGPEVTWPTARMLATLPAGGPNGKVYWDEKEYVMFDPDRIALPKPKKAG